MSKELLRVEKPETILNINKINMKKTILIFFIITTALSFKAYAQFSINFSGLAYYDDNIFRSANKSGSFITNTNLNTSFDINRDQSLTKFSYNANLAFFNDLPLRNFNEHSFLIDYTQVSESEETMFNLGGGYSFKLDKDIYNLYDERNFGLYSNYKFNINEDIASNLGYSYNLIKYPNFSEMNYSEHIFNAVSNFSFQTKTTYIADVSLGFKTYLEDLFLSTTTGTISSSGIGQGKGMWMMGRGISGQTVNITKADNLTSQILISNRIAQSISDKIGMQITYSLRFNIDNNTRSVFGGSNYIADDELFDDHYGYEGHEFNLGYTMVLPWNMLLKTDGEYLIKNYTNQFNSAPIETSPLINRNDKKFIFTVSLKKKFEIFENVLNPFNLFLNYIYQNNKSSVAYINYNSNSVFLGISTNIVF